MNGYYPRLELRRLLRDRRTFVISLLMPPAMFLIVGAGTAANQQETVGDDANRTALLLVSVALFGAIVTTVSGGASVSTERAQGWTRQLRLTPLSPWSYVMTKVVASMALGAVSIGLTFGVGYAQGAQMSPAAWVGCALIAWLSSGTFAALGLLMGYVLPTENTMQMLSPLLAVLSLAGGLFVPLGDGPFADVGRFVPTYGAAVLTRAPLGTGLDAWAIVNLLVWTVLFVAAAAWRFGRDTARV
ncbi:ABC transporter permease [Promicromonospora xylanilytica]